MPNDSAQFSFGAKIMPPILAKRSAAFAVFMLVQATGFATDLSKGKMFRSVDERSSVKIISADELELTQGVEGPHWVCKYSKDGDSLRVVATVLGSPQALYFKVTAEGLQDAGGIILYDSEHFDAAFRAAKLAEEERQKQMLASALTPSPNPTVPPDSRRPMPIYAPRPQYPYEARSRSITGSGVVVMTIDVSGSVTGASMAKSTGSPILDNAASSAFRQWRFAPGTTQWELRMPFNFTTSGAS
jgi:TonB family protein